MTAVAVAACAALSAWQVGRGSDKARLRAQLSAGGSAEALTAQAPPPAPMAWRRVTAAGEYLAGRSLLLDGQSHAGRPGYHAWTPLRLADGGLALVDRGWVADPAAASEPPAGSVRVRGIWRDLPEPGLRLANAQCPEQKAFPMVVLYPTAADLECLLGERGLPGLLLLDPAEPGGFVREWGTPGMSPSRHYAYAAQWLALAFTAVVFYLVLNLKRRPPDDSTRGPG